MIKKILIAFALIVANVAYAVPLQNWSTWNANYPYVARQIPPNALIMRGIGTNEYYVAEIDPATGEIPVALSGASISIDYSGETGQPVPADAAFIGGEDPNGDLQGVAVDTNGRLQIDAVTDNDFAGPTGSPVPTEAGYVGGIDSNGDLQGLLVDTSGQLQVEVTASALPSGAATEAKQDSEIALLTTIDADTGTIVTNTGTTATNTGTIVTNTGTTATNTGTIASNTTAIESDTTNIEAYTFSTSQSVSSIALRTPLLGQSTMSGSSPVVIASDQSPVSISSYGKEISTSAYLSYASTPVTTGAWQQLVASTAAATNLLCITDQSGQATELGLGGSGSEARIFLMAPGFSGCVPLRIDASQRISVRAVSATANSGSITLSGMN